MYLHSIAFVVSELSVWKAQKFAELALSLHSGLFPIVSLAQSRKSTHIYSLLLVPLYPLTPLQTPSYQLSPFDIFIWFGLSPPPLLEKKASFHLKIHVEKSEFL